MYFYVAYRCVVIVTLNADGSITVIILPNLGRDPVKIGFEAEVNAPASFFYQRLDTLVSQPTGIFVRYSGRRQGVLRFIFQTQAGFQHKFKTLSFPGVLDSLVTYRDNTQFQ